jgi:hypothetical protein
MRKYCYRCSKVAAGRETTRIYDKPDVVEHTALPRGITTTTSAHVHTVTVHEASGGEVEVI